MANQQNAQQVRPDVVVATDAALKRALRARSPASPKSALGDSGPRDRAIRDLRLRVRNSFIEPATSDPFGYERVVGESDLMSINFLSRGMRAADAVCRIRVPAPGGEWYGTGCLVGPRLLMTNHHVLSSEDDASQAEAEFGYDHDVDGVLRRGAAFNLRPHEVFFTDAALDITFVAVAPLSEGGVPLERYGNLPLLPQTGKAVDGEWVSIVQHPGGEAKQIAIRASQIVVLDCKAVPNVNLEHFVHYTTDTDPGSSGAPVLNDQWQVVALHHKAVPAPKSKKGGKPEWIANEGIRVSAIFKLLERNRLERPMAGAVLDRLENALGFTSMASMPLEHVHALEADRKPFKPTRWAGAANLGYDRNFLPERLDLATICAPAVADNIVAPLKSGHGHELKYWNFSVVVHKDRKFALLTAVNINGSLLMHPGPRSDAWRQDPRMAEEYQPDGDFYEKKKGDDKIQFSRGHLVRRFDPCWGDRLSDAQMGEVDTFHYSNAAPQFQTYNDVDWGNLEDYLLDKSQMTEKKMTVFTGPIFRDDDPLYGRNRPGGPWQIPLSFWKVVVLEKTPGVLAAAAFILGQTQYVQALYEARVFSGLKPYTPQEIRSRHIQTTVEAIEQESGLDFSDVRPFDSQGGLEATRRTRWITRPEDVLI